MEKANFTNFENPLEINENSHNNNFLAVMIRKRRFIFSEKQFLKWHFKKILKLHLVGDHVRLQNSRIFCEREQRSILDRKVWNKCKNGEDEWGEALKNTTVCHACVKFVQNYLFFQQREIPTGLILTQPVIKCHSHLIKKI